MDTAALVGLSVVALSVDALNELVKLFVVGSPVDIALVDELSVVDSCVITRVLDKPSVEGP